MFIVRTKSMECINIRLQIRDLEWRQFWNYSVASSLATAKGFSTGRVPLSAITTCLTGLSEVLVFELSIFRTTL